MPPQDTVPEQVRLPLRVAAGVVAQGIRIRLGRSVVTVVGIVLGIAFLMSMLAGQVLRRGLGEEDRRREAADRAFGLLVAECGPVRQRVLAVSLSGPGSDLEARLLSRLRQEGVASIRLWSAGGAESAQRLVAQLPVDLAENAAGWGQGATAFLLLGGGPAPDIDWAAALAGARQKILATTRSGAEPPAAGVPCVELLRELPAEEQVRVAAAARSERFRAGWIIAISLLVTVIGISNAMLMSVTERFRDIGTMKCLGALSSFIRMIFLLESAFMGVIGGAAGVLLGGLFSIGGYLLVYGPDLVGQTLAREGAGLAQAALYALAAGMVLSVVAAIYPAQFAARMVPAAALRSNI